MTKDEAIKRLIDESCKYRLYCELYPDACMKKECEIYMAIKALEERPWREYIGKHEAYMIMCDVMDVLYEKEAIKKAVYERLKQAPSIGEWIPCSERLPEAHESVLVTIRGHDVIVPMEGETIEEAIERISKVRYVSVGFLGEDGWYGADGFPSVVSPVAWMPLPPVYKGGEEE